MRHRCMEDNHSSFLVTCPGKAEINHKLPSICGARWLGTILVSKYMMGKWEGERQRGRKVRVLRREGDLKRQGQWRNGWHGWLFATDSHGDIWAWAAPKGRVLIRGPVTILMVCIDMRSSCYYWRPCSHLKLGHHILPCWCPRNVPPWRCSRCQRPQTGPMINYNERLQVKMYRLKRVVPFCLFIFFFFCICVWIFWVLFFFKLYIIWGKSCKDGGQIQRGRELNGVGRHDGKFRKNQWDVLK